MDPCFWRKKSLTFRANYCTLPPFWKDENPALSQMLSDLADTILILNLRLLSNGHVLLSSEAFIHIWN